MHKFHRILPILILTSLLTACTGNAAMQVNEITPTTLPVKAEPMATLEVALMTLPADCPVTVPQNPVFVPPEPYSSTSPFPDYFWYGTNALWTLVPVDGMWSGLGGPPGEYGYGQKVFWWREGYIWNEEPQPQIEVTAERLDAPAPVVHSFVGTNAYASDIGSAMLTGVTFPAHGCWEVTGQYKKAELTFVVWIAP
jgi:hypothetical protein